MAVETAFFMARRKATRRSRSRWRARAWSASTPDAVASDRAAALVIQADSCRPDRGRSPPPSLPGTRRRSGRALPVAVGAFENQTGDPARPADDARRRRVGRVALHAAFYEPVGLSAARPDARAGDPRRARAYRPDTGSEARNPLPSTMQLNFTKMNGAGNDFVITEANWPDHQGTPVARYVCDRATGVGVGDLLPSGFSNPTNISDTPAVALEEQIFLFEAVLGPANLEQALHPPPFHGSDHDPSDPELFDQFHRYVGGGRGDDDTVERRLAGPAEMAVRIPGIDVVQVEFVKPPPRQLEQFFDEARERFNALQAAERLAKSRVATVQVDIDKSTLRAPYAAVVIRRFADEALVFTDVLAQAGSIRQLFLPQCIPLQPFCWHGCF